jgi:hypothetical protein
LTIVGVCKLEIITVEAYTEAVLKEYINDVKLFGSPEFVRLAPLNQIEPVLTISGAGLGKPPKFGIKSVLRMILDAFVLLVITFEANY